MSLARTLSAVLLLLVLLVTGLTAAELGLRFAFRDHYAPVQPCLRFGNPRFHHLYAPDCVDGIYRFNHFGLRAPPLNTLKKNRIAVLGDSEVKGLYAPVEDSIPQVFEESTNDQVSFVNMGVRFTGPLLQSALFYALNPILQAKGVIWFLNGGDPIEERFFFTKVREREGKFGIPTDFITNQTRVPWGSSQIELLNFWFRTSLFKEWRETALNTPPSDKILCGAIRSLSAYLKYEKIPLMFVFAPKSDEALTWQWLGLPYDRTQLKSMIECARATGAYVEDLTNEPLSADHFYPDRIHFRRKGAEWIAGRIAPRLEVMVRSAETPP